MSITHRSNRTAARTAHLGVFVAIATLFAAALTAGPASTANRSGASSTPRLTPRATISTSQLSTVAAKKKLSHTDLFKAHIVTATNTYRKAHHLKALSVTKCLSNFAAPWAKHMAKAKGLSHQNLGPFLSHCNANYAAENVASGNVSGAQVVKMWVNSPEHRANLLGKHYKHVAIGAVKSGGQWYVVQDFSS
jgi:uncharacterized protein YkwD